MGQDVIFVPQKYLPVPESPYFMVSFKLRASSEKHGLNDTKVFMCNSSSVPKQHEIPLLHVVLKKLMPFFFFYFL